MGYQSQVAITISGRKQQVQDVMTAYKLSETAEQIDNAWHILSTEQDSETQRFYTEWGDNDDRFCSIVFMFNWVKFYDKSQGAVSRLGSLIDTYNEGLENPETSASVGLRLIRIGENADDYEEEVWGEGSSYDSEVYLSRQLVPELDEEEDALELLYENQVVKPEQTDMVSESSQQKEQ